MTRISNSDDNSDSDKSDSKGSDNDDSSKRFEESLHDIEGYLDAVFNNMGDPIFVKDESCRLLLVNDAFCNMFNLPRDQIIGKTLAERVPTNEREHFLSIDKQVLESGQEVLSEETLTIGGCLTKTVLTKKIDL